MADFSFAPIDYGSALGLNNQVDPREQRLKRQQVEVQRQQQAMLQQAAQAKAQQQQAYQAATAEVLKNPTADGFASLQLRFPEQHEAITQSWKLKDETAQATDLKDMARLYGHIQTGIKTKDFTAAEKVLQDRITAEKAAGLDTSEDEETLALIKKDPAAALGTVGLALSSVGGVEKFAAIQEQLRLGEGKGGDPFTLGPMETRYDANGNVIATNPNKFVEINGRLYQVEGGAPGAAAPTDPKGVFDSMLRAESGGQQFTNGKPTTSAAGAVGIAQIMPGTGPEAARLAGVEWDPRRLREDGDYNRKLGEAYFTDLLRQFDGDTRKAVAAYNAGPGSASLKPGEKGYGRGVRGAMARAAKAGAPDDWERFLPAETKGYLGKVLGGGGPTASAASARPLTPPKPAEPTARRMSPEEVVAEGLDSSVVYYRDKEGIPRAVSGQKNDKITDGQRQSASLTYAALGGNDRLNELARKRIYKPSPNLLISEANGVTRLVMSNENDRLFVQAAKEFLAPILRKDTGAAVTDNEFVFYQDTYIPRPEDSPAVLWNKARARDTALRRLYGSASNAFDTEYGKPPKWQVLTDPRGAPKRPAQKAPSATGFKILRVRPKQ